MHGGRGLAQLNSTPHKDWLSWTASGLFLRIESRLGATVDYRHKRWEYGLLTTAYSTWHRGELLGLLGTAVPRAIGSEILQRGRDAQYDRIPASRQETAEVCVAVSTLTSPAHRIVPNNSE